MTLSTASEEGKRFLLKSSELLILGCLFLFLGPLATASALD